LDDAAASFLHEAERFNEHAFAAAFGVRHPPVNGLCLTFVIHQIDLAIGRGEQEISDDCAEKGESLHVPVMVPVDVHVAFRRQQMKGRELQITERLHGPAIVAITSAARKAATADEPTAAYWKKKRKGDR